MDSECEHISLEVYNKIVSIIFHSMRRIIFIYILLYTLQYLSVTISNPCVTSMTNGFSLVDDGDNLHILLIT